VLEHDLRAVAGVAERASRRGGRLFTGEHRIALGVQLLLRGAHRAPLVDRQCAERVACVEQRCNLVRLGILPP
jgi:hypothetical protein